MKRNHAKQVLFWWLHLPWKKGRRAKQFHYSRARVLRFLDCRKIHKKFNSNFSIWGRRVSVWNPEGHCCSLLHIALHLELPQCRPWPCSCLLCTLGSEMLWEQLLGNNLLWSRTENFSPFKESTSLENLTLFYSDLFFLPSVLLSTKTALRGLWYIFDRLAFINSHFLH